MVRSRSNGKQPVDETDKPAAGFASSGNQRHHSESAHGTPDSRLREMMVPRHASPPMHGRPGTGAPLVSIEDFLAGPATTRHGRPGASVLPGR